MYRCSRFVIRYPDGIHIISQLRTRKYLATEVFKDSLSIDKFLGQETSGTNHGQTSVLEFLGLQDCKLRSVLRLQAKRVESKVSWDVVGTEKAGLVNGDILGFNPADLGTLGLSTGNTSSQKDPEDRVDLSQVGDGRSSDFSVEKESLALDGLSDKEPNGGKHGNTSVGQFSLTVSLQSGFIGLGGKSSRIPESNWLERTDDGVNRESL